MLAAEPWGPGVLMDIKTSELIQAFVALAAIGVVVGFARKVAERKLLAVAGILAVLSIGAWVRFGSFHAGEFLHNWDLYHYYLGARYFEELGYEDLYRCTLQADDELSGEMSSVDRVRDLHTLRFTTRDEVLAGPDCRDQFSRERWASFKADVAFFADITPRRLWRLILIDKGYNGTPPWTLYAGALAEWAGTSPRWRINLACSIDLVLAALMLLGVLWAFGPRAALLATIFFGVNFANRFQHVGGSLLRMDWLAGLVLALCAIKKERWTTAGVLVAVATMARVFPIVFALGLAIRAGIDLVKSRRLEKRYLKFAAGAAAGAAVLFGLSMLAPRGWSAWTEFSEDISAHARAPAAKRIGLKYVVLVFGGGERGSESDEGRDEVVERWESRKPIALAIAAVALLLFGLAVRRLDDAEAFALGVIPLFFLLAPTRYYWAILIAPVIVWAALQRPWEREALCALLVMQVFLFLFNRTGPDAMVLSTISSFCLLVLFSHVLYCTAGDDVRSMLKKLRRAEE